MPWSIALRWAMLAPSAYEGVTMASSIGRSAAHTTPLIVGWGHTNFGKLAERSLEQLVVEAGAAALQDAGVAPGEIDLVVMGHFNAGMSPLAFPSSLALQIHEDLFGVHAMRVENACASGSAAVQTALAHLEAGLAKRVLVIGAEKMTGVAPDIVGRALLGADYEAAGTDSTTGFAGLFAHVAAVYEERYGSVSDALGLIAAKSHRLGAQNPYAHLQRDLGVEFCSTPSEKNPLVAGALRRTDCSPVSDGAAALLISTEPTDSAHPPVAFASWAAANDFLPASRRDPLAFAATERAWEGALHSAGVGLGDLDLIELHDCFTIAELNLYEVLGIVPRGAGIEAVTSGAVLPGGEIPVNPSGGLKSKGHPVGATGVSQHVLAAMQLTGRFPGAQVEGAKRAAVHNMGGLAVANYVSVLEATE